MAFESTNDWKVKIVKRAVNDEHSYWILADLYKGENYRASVRWMVGNEEDEADDSVVARKWDAINEAKTMWLEENA